MNNKRDVIQVLVDAFPTESVALKEGIVLYLTLSS